MPVYFKSPEKLASRFPVLDKVYSGASLSPKYLKLPCAFQLQSQKFPLCKLEERVPPRPLDSKVMMVFPKSVSFLVLKGSIITIPPIASPPYCKAEAPLRTVIFPAAFTSKLGACSIPHCWSSSLTLLLKIATRLLCKPLITGFTTVLPFFKTETPETSLSRFPND